MNIYIILQRKHPTFEKTFEEIRNNRARKRMTSTQSNKVEKVQCITDFYKKKKQCQKMISKIN